MKKIVLVLALLLGANALSHATELNSTDARVMKTMDGVSENLTAFSGATRGSALNYFESKTQEEASSEVKIYALDYLLESVTFFSADTSIRSQKLVRDIAVTSKDTDVALKGIDVLETAIEFRLTGSTRERISALNCLLEISNSENFKNNREVQDHTAEVLTPYMDSNYDSIRNRVLTFLENY